jgi:hypothetical protein
VDRICYQGLAATEYTGKELKQDQEGIDKKTQQRNLSAGLLRRYFGFIQMIQCLYARLEVISLMRA